MTGQSVVSASHFGRSAVVGGVVVDSVMAVIGGLIFSVAQDERGASGFWGPLALACIVAAPGFLALLGLFNRPWLLVGAGLLLFPMCFLSFSFLFFPLLVPAIIFLTVAVVRPRAYPRPAAQCVAAVLSLLFVIAAFASLLVHDPGESSDVITLQEALTSLGFFVAAIAVAALAPRDGHGNRR